MKLQDRIKYIQNELGMTQKEFARILQVPAGSVTDWYNKGVTPRSDKLIRMVEIFSVNPSYLITGQGCPFIRMHKWKEKDEIALNKKYSHLLFLINHYQKGDLIKGFYNIHNVNNWREALDQKLGKFIFGGLYTIAKRFNVSPNVLLVETYSGFFYDIMHYLAHGKNLTADHLYILTVACHYHTEDLRKIFPENPISYLNKKDLYVQIEFKTRIKYAIYGLNEISKQKNVSNTAFLGIQEAFKQLDQALQSKDIPLFCEKERHNYFYWTSCPICDRKIDSPSMNYEFDFSNITVNTEDDSLDNFTLEICEWLSIMNKSKEELIENIHKLCN